MKMYSRPAQRFVLCSLLALLWPSSLMAQETVNAARIFLDTRVIDSAATRITIDGANIIVEPGSTAITTLGTIGTGTWQGTVVGTTFGGCGAAWTPVLGRVMTSSASGCVTLATGVTGTFLRSSDGTSVGMSTLILPNAATTNRIPYATSSNTWGESGNLTFTGSAFSVTGSASVSTTAVISGLASLNGGIAVDGAAFTVEDATGNTEITGYVGTPTYVSQTTGWRCDGSGACDFRYLFTDELHAKAFIADLEQALAGGQIITKSVAMVGKPFTMVAAGAASTVAGGAGLWVKDLPSAPNMAVFVSGDFVVLRTFDRANGGLIIGDAVGQVTVYADGTGGDAGLQSWTWTRSASFPGAMLASTVVPVDAISLDYGTSGNGYYEVSAIDGTVNVTSITRVTTTATVTSSYPHGYLSGDTVRISGATQSEYNGAFVITVTSGTVFTYTVAGSPTTPATGTILMNDINGTNAPYAQIVTWVTAPTAVNRTLRTRFGNLRGITGVNGEYGFIAGTYSGTNGQYLRASSSAFELHGIDLSMWDGTTKVFSVIRGTNAPALAIGGGGTPPTAINQAGIFLGWNTTSDVAQFSLYQSAAEFFLWDGTNLSWDGGTTSLDTAGHLTTTSATIAAFTTAATTVSATNLVLTSGAANVANIAVGTGANTCGLNSAASGTDIGSWCGSTHANRATAPARITAAGAATFSNVNATGGTIASFAIEANQIASHVFVDPIDHLTLILHGDIPGASYLLLTGGTNATRNGVLSSTSTTGVAFFAGALDPATAPFRVLFDGTVVMNNLTVTSGLYGTGGTSITTVGTITTGVWQGTSVKSLYGGTGKTTGTVGDLIYWNNTTAYGTIAASTSGFVLTAQGAGAAPIWAAATLAGAALTDVDDTNIVLTLGGSPTTALVNAASVTVTWAGTLAAARLNANVVQAVANDTNITGSISAQTLTLAWASTLSAARGGCGTAWTPAAGALVFSTVSGCAATAVGSTGQIPRSAAAGTPTWSTATYPATVTAGRMIAATTTNVIGELAAGSSGQILQSTGAGVVPGWTASIYPASAAAAGTFIRSDATNYGNSTLVLPNAATAGHLVVATTTNTIGELAAGSAGQIVRSAGAGVVPTWSTATYPATAGAAGTFIRSDGTNFGGSTLVLPNAATTNRIPYATGSNTWGESGNLTFTGSAFAVTGSVSVSGLASLNGGIAVDGAAFTVEDATGNTEISGFVGDPSFVSRTTGWRCDASGACDLRFLYVDEMHAKSFIADLEQALAGGQIITKSVAMVGTAFTLPAAAGTGTLWVQDLPSAANMAAFVSGDAVVLRVFDRQNGGLIIADAVGVVTAYADGTAGNEGKQSWTFTRNATATAGSATTGAVIPVDAIALDFGTSGNGYYEVSAIDGTVNVTSITRVTSTATVTTSYPHGFLTSDSVLVSGANHANYNGVKVITVTSPTVFTYTVAGTPPTPDPATAILLNDINGTNAPYAQIVTWATAPIAANRTLRTRFGNLRGITGVNGEYGMVAGTYAASNGQYFRASSSAFELHGIDLSMWDGATKVFAVTRGTNAPSLALGTTPPTAVATAGSGPAGVFLGWQTTANLAQISAWSSATKYLIWDGTDFSWSAGNTSLSTAGHLTTTSATIGGFTIAATTLTSANLQITSGASNVAHVALGGFAGLNSGSAGSDIAFWAGDTHANRTIADFRVTIDGAITATAGTIGGFTISADYLRDTANSFGMASTVTGGDDVRFWAGDTFVNRATADFWLTESGAFHLGTAAGNRIDWNGTNLTVVSAGFTIDSTGILLTSDPSAPSNSSSYKFTSAGTDTGLYRISGWRNVNGAVSTKAIEIAVSNLDTSSTTDDVRLDLNAGNGTATVEMNLRVLGGVPSLELNAGLSTGVVDINSPITALYSISERGRTVPMGEWAARAFTAGDFTASGGGSWTVASGDFLVFRYMLIGKTMWVNLIIQTSTSAGTVNALKVLIPGGFTAAQTSTQTTMSFIHSGAGAWLGGGGVETVSTDTSLYLYLPDRNSNWPASTDVLYTRFVAAFEVQ